MSLQVDCELHDDVGHVCLVMYLKRTGHSINNKFTFSNLNINSRSLIIRHIHPDLQELAEPSPRPLYCVDTSTWIYLFSQITTDSSRELERKIRDENKEQKGPFDRFTEQEDRTPPVKELKGLNNVEPLLRHCRGYFCKTSEFHN